MAWNPSLYLRHNSARLRPALDLLEQTVIFMQSSPKPANEVRTVLDLGCGPGNVTSFLTEAFPNAVVHGVDSSEEMITTAKKSHENSTFKNRVSFSLGTIEGMAVHSPMKYDVVFTNAALHWVPNHNELFPRLIGSLLNSDGVLAVQMPDTRAQPSHLLMETAALRSGVIQKTCNVRIPRTEEDPKYYFNFLFPICKDMDMWSTEYVQQLRHSESSTQHPVLEYTRSTGLLPILNAIGGENSEAGKRYLLEYERLLHEEYPLSESNNTNYKYGSKLTIFPFKRFFLLARV